MIYLFCNDRYGLPFMLAANSYYRTNKIDLKIVFSGKRRRIDIVNEIKIFIEHYVIRKIMQRDIEIPLIFVRNVNSESFSSIINPHDHGIIAGFNQIFNPSVISKFKSLVNIHPSLLPLYRGPVPSYWCIRNGESKTGYTFHVVTEHIDQGEILYQDEVEIERISDPSVLDLKISVKASRTFVDYLQSIDKGNEFNRRIVDANSRYNKHVEYASFPIAD